MKPSNAESWRRERLLIIARSIPALILVLLFALPGIAPAAQAAPASPTVVHFTQAQALEQPPGALAPVTATVDETALAGSWVPVTLPLSFKHGAETAQAKGPRTTWLRVRLDALQDLRGPTQLYLLRWISPGRLSIYADGRLIYRSPGSPVWNLFRHPPVLVPLDSGENQAPPRELLFRIDWVPTQVAAISSFYAGDAAAVVRMAERRDLVIEQIPFMISAGFVLVGSFALGVWIFRRKYPGHLIFFISVLSMTRRWHFQLGIERLPISDTWFIWLTLNALVWEVVAIHHLLQFLHGRVQRNLTRALVGAGVVISLITLPEGLLPLPQLLFVRHIAEFLIIVMAFVVMVMGLWNAWRARSSDAMLLAVANAINFVCGVTDYIALMDMKNVERFFTTPDAALLFSLTIIYLMFRRYVSAMNEIEGINVKLEARVQAREAELAESYERLREVEQHQTLSRERTRLMQDMHDGLGSSLTSALRAVESGGSSDAQLKEVLKSCIDDLKLTIDSMEPVEADLLLLLATLRYRLGLRLKSAGITLHWEVTDLPRLAWLTPHTSLHILRIVQEAFSNILKHTQASEIRVATGANEKQVWVSIADNGPGFDLEEARRRGGRGLMNQLRRAAELGGEIRWDASAAGTRLLLLLPLDAA